MMDKRFTAEEVDYARRMMTCPGRLGHLMGRLCQVCAYEPACVTNEPREGWQHVLDNAEDCAT